ncbi:hypothetical protein CWO91_16690 [Bradyrhizobium genosp. SA-3]|nr:hypothetical protein CWO91_16690 [Bradyrhizobium genosp. SA-3]
MTDDECLVAAMLLGLDWRRWASTKGGTFNTTRQDLRMGRRFAVDKYDAARMFLNERATPSNPRR